MYNIQRYKKIAGFTLVEILVVLAIISVLSAIVLTSVTEVRKNSRDKKRVADLAQIQLALKLYQTKYGHYPKESEGYSGGSGRGGICTDCTNPISTALREFMPTVPEDPLYDPSSTEHQYRYYYDGWHWCEKLGSFQAVLMARRMETDKYKNMVGGFCDKGDILIDYGSEGRGSGNSDTYYIHLGPGSA